MVVRAALAELDGVKAKLAIALPFRDAMLKCIALDPDVPTFHHALGIPPCSSSVFAITLFGGCSPFCHTRNTGNTLGRWYYDVSRLSWMERKIASSLVGAPLTATAREALEQFTIAEQLTPNAHRMNLVFMGLAHRACGDTEQAIICLQRAANGDCTISLDDTEALDKAAAALHDLHVH